MEQVKEYMLVMATGAEHLSEKVNDLIKDGWQPFGAGSVTWGKVDTLPGTLNNKIVDGYMASQAMVRY